MQFKSFSSRCQKFKVLLLFAIVFSMYRYVPKAFEKAEVLVSRLSKCAYKAVLSSLGLVCATRSDHISFSSPGQKFFNSAIVCYSLFKVLIIT